MCYFLKLSRFISQIKTGFEMEGNINVAAEQLRSFIERIEKLEEDRQAIAQDVKDVFAEAKNSGFEPKIMKVVLKIRKMDKNELDEQETLLQIYKEALGMAV